MSQFVVQTTPVQDAALELLVADVNREAVVTGQTPWTAQSYVLARVGDMLASYSEQYAGRILETAARIYPTLTDDQRKQILTALGRPAFAALPLADQVDTLNALALADFKKLNPDVQRVILETLGLVS